MLPPRPPSPPHRWVGRVQQFVQLSDLPQDRTLALHLKCLNSLATAIAEEGGPHGMEARVLLQRCREAEDLLHQHDLAELSSRAAQQEKEQLQAIYKSASDESSHLMLELTSAAEAARRTAVKLRGRETGGWVALVGLGLPLCGGPGRVEAAGSRGSQRRPPASRPARFGGSMPDALVCGLSPCSCLWGCPPLPCLQR